MKEERGWGRWRAEDVERATWWQELVAGAGWRMTGADPVAAERRLILAVVLQAAKDVRDGGWPGKDAAAWFGGRQAGTGRYCLGAELCCEALGLDVEAVLASVLDRPWGGTDQGGWRRPGMRSRQRISAGRRRKPSGVKRGQTCLPRR